MRYTLLLLLIIAALHSGCQTSTAQRDKVIADSVKSYTERLNVDHVSYTVTVLKVDLISARELIDSMIASSDVKYKDAIQDIARDSFHIGSLKDNISLLNRSLESLKDNNSPETIKNWEKQLKDDSASLHAFLSGKDHISHEQVYDSMSKTRDSLGKLLPASDAVKKDNYKVLIQLAANNNKVKAYVYLDDHYSVAAVSHEPADEKR